MGSIGRAWWDGAEDLFGARAFDLCEPRDPRGRTRSLGVVSREACVRGVDASVASRRSRVKGDPTVRLV